MKKIGVFLVMAVAIMLFLPASFVYAIPCSDEHIYDDGGAEQGYSFNPAAGNPSAICQKFIPCSYLYRFSKFSLALTRFDSGVENWTFQITMWKNAGGMPGEIMDSTTVTASALPVWPTTAFYDFLLPSTWAPVAATEDSVFIGIQTDPLTMTGVFVGADESTTTPLWPGYATFAAGPWSPVETYSYWAGYRALLFRAEGRGLICADNDSDVYSDNCTTCEVNIIPKTLGRLIGGREKTKYLFIIGQKGTDFGETPAIRWESDAIDVVSTSVFFKRFMFMRATFNGEPLYKQEYRVHIGNCTGSIKWAK